jgi:archaellum component FlaG (FlaF/FlaG flagellin family)
LKNIGEGSLITTNETFQIFVDGEIISTANYNFSDTSIWSGEYTTMYVVNSMISAGDHNLRIVGPQAVEDEFEFKI